MSLTITFNGKQYEAEQGSMIIEVADNVGVKIPRFCYHPFLSIAANCRMCLVEVSNSSKPVPACSTPITDGMVVSTLSQKTKEAQQAVMEFLLINHPLDCPICDQGGECELQDLSLKYGHDSSHYHEPKRTAEDLELGPLIATEMTRCIHCTRCVRFGTEVAGVREMGATGRGEFMSIGTFLARELQSELSGNIIDLCPVGALTSKPTRFIGRSWEFKQKDGLALHDSCFSAVYWNSLNDQLKRVLPRTNPNMNQIWLSDRDRFSFIGLGDVQRLTKPKIKRDKQWQECSWKEALDFTQSLFDKQEPTSIGSLYHPLASLEESILLNELTMALSNNNKDAYLINNPHPLNNLPFNLESLKTHSLLIIGSFFNLEQPILAHHVRQALLQGTAVFNLSLIHDEMGMSGLNQFVAQADSFASLIASLRQDHSLDSSLEIESFRKKIHIASKGVNVLICSSVQAFPDYHQILIEAEKFASCYQGKVGVLGMSNAAGCQKQAQKDLHLFNDEIKLLITLHAEPEDFSNDLDAREAFEKSHEIIALCSFEHPVFLEKAKVLLPIGLLAENQGHYSDCFGAIQYSQQAINGVDVIKPAWKVLAALLKGLKEEGDKPLLAFNDIYPMIKTIEVNVTQKQPLHNTIKISEGDHQLIRVPHPYALDSILRRSLPLQQLQESLLRRHVWISSDIQDRYKLIDGEVVRIFLANGKSLEKTIVHKEQLAANTMIYWSGLIYEECVIISGAVRLEAII